MDATPPPLNASFELMARVARRAALRALFGRDTPPVRVGRYRLERTLGCGGMGVVFLARDDELDRDVALKLVPPLAPDRAGAEARLLAQINHPHVVQVFDVGAHEGQLFIAMEYVDGETLEAWLRAPRPVDATLAVLREVAAGLAAVHAAGVVHRDVKPANVIVGRDGRARVADFGLADRADADAVGGTLRYAAPEQRAGAPADRRADVYAFAVTAHLALTGAWPGADAERVPRRLRTALERALEPDPAARAPDLSELTAALAPSERSRGRWLVAALVAAVGAGAFALRPTEDPLYAGVAEAPLPADAPRILWVDDNPRYNASEIAALQARGIRVVTAVSIEEAATRGLRGYAAILSDMERQERAGFDEDAGLHLIREVRARGLDTPVFIYTAERLVPVLTPVVRDAGGQGVAGRSKVLLRFVEQAVAEAR